MKKNLVSLFFIMIAQLSNAQTMSTLWIRASPSNSAFRYFDNAPTDAATGDGGPGIVIADWTSGGSFYVWRAVLSFDLSTIPDDATIDTAYLSLWANPTSPSGNVGNPTFGTANAVGVYRIVDAWDTNTVCWDDQPGFAYTDGDTLAQSTSDTQNYLNTNVTTLVKNMLLYEGRYGFMLKHIQEINPYNSMIFYSPYQYATDTSITPLLVIKYTAVDPDTSTGILNINTNAAYATVYPNPASSFVNIKVRQKSAGHVSVTLSDVTGRALATRETNVEASDVNIGVDLSNFAKGIYLVKVTDHDGNITIKKLTVN